MAAPNNDPIFSRIGDLSNNSSNGMNQLITVAANDYTGASTNNSLVFTADATNGSYLERIRIKAGGTNVASVARFFINNGSGSSVSTNNQFYGEVSLPATTLIATAATVEIDYPMGFALNPGFRVYMGLGTSAAAGWVATPIAGKY